MVSMAVNFFNNVRMLLCYPAQTKKSTFYFSSVQFFQNAIYAFIDTHLVFIPVKITGNEIAVVPVFYVEGKNFHEFELYYKRS